MDYEEVIQTIKEFFNSKNAEFNVGQPQKTENNTISIVVDFKEPIELTEEEYDDLYDFLDNLGFYPINGAENQVNNYIGYKSWVGVDEFENDDGDEVIVYYTKVCTGGKTTFFIKKIEVELNIQENTNEL
ncbi:hypothetical protein AZ270_gp72 [Acidianus tailed spindle virus]|uniref:hypothetical protein n=1 Tax=Acidianus tailed spindle virus TaxID=1797140 RepID=UPI00076F31B4|nr:hypothetical protein AZ270_gp72 [Acidianus tailed spindle virus]AME30095.1 hypothetical protein ATSV_E129 [Acidianus tailed spindle virus]